MTLYYAETDGKLFLEKRNGNWSFPSSREDLPFSVRKIREIDVDGKRVVFCLPKLERHPKEWFNKDQIPQQENVTPTVRKAINLTLPRLVTEAIIQIKNEVLLVKPDRGYNKNRWTLPGGFVVYGESPEEAIKREASEELGTEISPLSLLNVHSRIGNNRYHWFVFYFEAEIESTSSPEPKSEIREIGYFKPEGVPQKLESPIMAEGYKEIIEREDTD